MNSTVARRRRARHVDTSDLIAALSRLMTAVGARVAEGTLEELAALIRLHDDLDSAIQEAVEGLRDAGATWDELGAVTGHTRQAAIKRWNR